jgi:hypothetical protein
MGFNRNVSTRGRVANFPGNNDKDDSWKATGFLNISVPLKDGTEQKLVGIPLHATKVLDAKILSLLENDPDGLEKLVGRLTFNYRPATGNTAELDLDDGASADQASNG